MARPFSTHSLGLVGASLALFCGFRPYEGVRALSDLAAFGRPSQLEALREIVTLQPDGTYRVQPDWLALDAIAEQPHSSPFTPRFRAAFGEPRDTRVPLPFRSSQKGPAPTPDAQAIRFADLAASWQVLVEEAVLGLEGTRPRGAGLSIVLGSSVRVVRSLFAHRVGWALPLVVVLLSLAGILAILALVPAISPFVYPLL